MRIKKLLKSKIFWVIIIILVVIIALIVRSAQNSKKVEYATEEAKMGEIIQTVSATGQIKSASDIELNFQNSGQIAVRKVNTGDKVKTGDVLMQLKATDLGINVSKAQADLAEAQASLDKVVAGATPEDIAVYEALVQTYQTDLANAKTDSVNAEKTYLQALENQRSNTVVAVNSALNKARISLQAIYDAMNYQGNDDNFVSYNNQLETQVLDNYDLGLNQISQAEADSRQASLEITDNKVDAAVNSTLIALATTKKAIDDMGSLLDYVVTNATLTQTVLGTLKTDINAERTITDTSINTVKTERQSLADARITYQTKVDAAHNAVSTAENNLTKSQADLSFKKAASRPEDVAVYRARVQRAQADLALAQDRYSDTILRAPIDGIITEVNYNVGEQTALTKTAIKMLAIQDQEIEVDIPESDISKVELGDAAQITLDAFTDDDILRGVVTKIDPAQTEIQDVIYYKVTVSLAAEQPENVATLKDKVKPGMTANIDIETAKIQNVLIIPSRAVKEKNSHKVVEVLENGQAVEVTVTTGLRGDGGLIEIISGLNQGQLVITFTKQ